MRAAALGFGLPCAAALLVLGLAWRWTGAGPLAHLLAKHHGGTTGWQATQLSAWCTAWLRDFGYLFAPVATAGLVFGMALAARCDRRGLLAIWAWAALGPLILLVKPSLIGYSRHYLLEAAYPAALLGVVLVFSLYHRLKNHTRARLMVALVSVAALAHMAIGGADDCLARSRLFRYTGVHTGWGNVKPDTGIKAAGWYVREYVPIHATIMALHTNRGMEASVASYYLGRQVLASYDLRPAMLEPLVQRMYEAVDVLVVNAEHEPLVTVPNDFERVCVLRNEGRPVRFIYARPSLALPLLDEEVAAVNTRYDRRFQPRHVPIPLPEPPGFEEKLRRYRAVIAEL